MNIPQDIVDEILSHLPVKSLKRFKVVCKDWYFNIKSDIFIAKHLKNQTTNEKILICNKPLRRCVVSICREQEEEEDDDDSRALFHQEQQWEHKDVKIIGTCNGLVCLNYTDLFVSDDSETPYYRIIALWNPATRDFKTLPSWEPHPPPRDIPGIGDCDHIGFGFDCTSNDYKVIRIMHRIGDECISQAAIYSLNSNSWRELDCSHVSAQISSLSKYGNTIFLGEKAYYLILAYDKLLNNVLLSIDMGKEVFQLTQLPSEHMELVKKIRYFFGIDFFTLRDSIALVIHGAKHKSEKILGIWTTKELVQGCSSWIKLLTIDPLSVVEMPLGFWRCKHSNDFLFMFRSHNANYRSAMKGVCIDNRGQIKNDRRMILKGETEIDFPFKVLTYVESLVSVNRS